MEIVIQDTYTLYKEMLSLEDNERTAFYEKKLMEPYQELYKITHMPMKPESMGCLSLSGNDGLINEMLERLKKGGAWEHARKAVEASAASFSKEGVSMPGKVVLGIFIGNPDALAALNGISGFGGIPGYIQIAISPNETNLKFLPSIIAHEFHHNVLFYNAKWNFMNVSLAKYLAVEGLAESFAESLYGSEYLGTWTESVTGDKLEKARAVIGDSLRVTGFNEVRKYIFGDQPGSEGGPEAAGLPHLSGYAVGYYAVQAFLKKTGVSIEKAALLEGEIIMEESEYFK